MAFKKFTKGKLFQFFARARYSLSNDKLKWNKIFKAVEFYEDIILLLLRTFTLIWKWFMRVRFLNIKKFKFLARQIIGYAKLFRIWVWAHLSRIIFHFLTKFLSFNNHWKAWHGALTLQKYKSAFLEKKNLAQV